jgi:hypothetical protein
MLSIHPIHCDACGKEHQFTSTGSEQFEQMQCAHCGAVLVFVDGAFPVIERLMMRSAFEFGKGDWTVTVILTAIACESLMSFLNKKWTLSLGRIPGEITVKDEEAWEEKFKDLVTIRRKLNATSRLMVGCALDEYVRGSAKDNPQFAKIYKPYEGHSPIDAFISSVFHRRNKIVHSGFIDSTEQDAADCRAKAMDLLVLLQIMDRNKYEGFNASLTHKLTEKPLPALNSTK